MFGGELWSWWGFLQLDSKQFPLGIDDNFVVPMVRIRWFRTLGPTSVQAGILQTLCSGCQVSCLVIQNTVDHISANGGEFF